MSTIPLAGKLSAKKLILNLQNYCAPLKLKQAGDYLVLGNLVLDKQQQSADAIAQARKKAFAPD